MTSAPPSTLVGAALCLGAGLVWGMAFFSWAVPLSVPVRVAATVLLVAALAAAARPGLLAAAGFALGMGSSSAFLLASGGQLFLEWWGLVPAVALVAGLALLVAALRRPVSAPDG